MHPRIQELLTYLDEGRVALIAAVSEAPPAILAERPGEGRWSIATVLEHLAIVERRTATMIHHELTRAQRAGLAAESESSSVMGLLDTSRLVDRSQRLVAGETARPTGTQSAEVSLEALASARAVLETALERVDGLAIGLIELPHPRFGLLNAYQWVLFLGAHERRHMAQIREILEALGGHHLQISTDSSRLDLDLIHGYLSEQSYWARGIRRSVVERSIRNSLCFGGFADGRQVAFARVITDRATFAYLADVFVVPELQGRGIGKALVRAVLKHPDLQNLKVVMLRTRDAHGLYSQFGFQPVGQPQTVMEILDRSAVARAN